MGLVKVASNVALVLNRYAAPAVKAPVLSPSAPMSTRSLPTAATEKPNASKVCGVGLVKVVSNVPLVLNKYAAPASEAPVLSRYAPMSTRSLPNAATDLPKKSPTAGVGLVKVVSNVPLALNRYAAPAFAAPVSS